MTITPVVRLTSDPLDAEAVRDFEAAIVHPGAGGLVTFQGVVRDHARGKRVRWLEYEAWAQMAERALAASVAEISRRWATSSVVMVHRVGRLAIGDCAVVVSVACAHRAEAFEACRYGIDTLKATVPIWKKEIYEDGE